MMPKSARRRTDHALTMPALDSPTTVAIAPMLAESDVAQRAFALYCNRGRQDRHDVDDWLNAERELRDASNSSVA